MFGLVTSVAVLAMRGAGLFQLLELRALDVMMALRPLEAVDDRVVVVGIGESDLNWLESPVVSDEAMANLLTAIKRQQPRMIGLDFYRNLPIQPGTKELTAIFETTPNLIGIEKIIIDKNDGSQSALPGNPVLTQAEQVAASDVIVDDDGRVRRGLLFPAAAGPRVIEGLGFRLALDYLAGAGINPEPDPDQLRIGKAVFPPVNRFTGGYANTNDGGYQVILNSRQSRPNQLVSLQQVLSAEIPDDLMRDRVVLIGSTALSSADVFYSAHSNAKLRDSRITFGIELHAELASYIISSVLDDRPTIWSLSEIAEILLIIALAYSGVLLQRSETKEWKRVVWLGGLSGGVAFTSYASLCFVGLWAPIIPMLLSLWGSSVLVGSQRVMQLRSLAEKDGLTQLANRRTFDEALQRNWMRGLRSQRPVALILCDVDHFKLYNDAYGHQQGDECLRHVAKTIRSTVKRSVDLPARYGGEEFVVLLPNTTANEAVELAEKIRHSIKAAQLPHKASKVSDHVTLSLGVTCLVPSMEVPMSSVVQFADLGLYRAKEAGRDRTNLHLPEMSIEDS